MASLYKRANGPQARMLKMVSGAVLNAAHAHPTGPVDERFARGVAKRAVGTISAQWAELLAAPGPSGAEGLFIGADRRSSHGSRRSRKAYLLEPSLIKGPAKGYDRWPHFAKAVKQIASLIAPARARGESARSDALIEALTILGRAAQREAR